MYSDVEQGKENHKFISTAGITVEISVKKNILNRKKLYQQLDEGGKKKFYFINGYKDVENKNTGNLYILYNKIKDLYILEFLGYNTIAVFFSLLAYISPFIFLYHFLGNQTDFSTQLISVFYEFSF